MILRSPKTNIAILTGGLGNQFFQISNALKECESTTYQFMSRNFRQDGIGTQDIDAFDIPNVSKVDSPLKFNWFSGRIANLILRFSNKKLQKSLPKIILIISKYFLSLALTISNRRFILVRTEISSRNLIPAHIVFLGYFQGAENALFGREIECLRSAKLNNLEIQEKIQNRGKNKNKLVIHVRKGDYADKKNFRFGVLKKDYYEKAIKFVFQNAIVSEVEVYSDDIEHAKELLEIVLPNDAIWIQSLYESTAATFEAMRHGSSYILANSSFSWWAARLCLTETPLVVYPQPWFKAQYSALESPRNWHAISSFKDSN